METPYQDQNDVLADAADFEARAEIQRCRCEYNFTCRYCLDKAVERNGREKLAVLRARIQHKESLDK